MSYFDPRLIVQILQFLVTLYNSRRSTSLPQKDERESQTAEEVPNPDNLQRVIKKVGKDEAPTEESVAAAIDEQFSPSVAQRIKDDITTFTILIQPPTFDDYDFFGLLEKYVKGMQAIAVKFELFRLRGFKGDNDLRFLEMPETAKVLIPRANAESMVGTIGERVSASVLSRKVVLTNESTEVPLVLGVLGKFQLASYGGYSGPIFESDNQQYRLEVGQENNWLYFEMFPTTAAGFWNFEFRLTALHLKGIFAALKKDIVTYLIDIEHERPLLGDLRREMEKLSA